MNKEKVLILSANNYDFVDKDTNRRITGVTVWLVPLNAKSDNYTNGIKPVKYSLPNNDNFFDDVNLPAYAFMEFVFDFARNKIVPSDFTDFVEFGVGELVG